jgi:hypothetical protein
MEEKKLTFEKNIKAIAKKSNITANPSTRTKSPK